MISTSDRLVAPVVKMFAEKGVTVACLVPTETGMEKSILDATEWVRRLLKDTGFHDYELQPQGEKRIVQAAFTSGLQTEQVDVSLYRPESKQGDPRIWIYGLKKSAVPGNLLVLFVSDGNLHIVNSSRTDLAAVLDDAVIAKARRNVTKSIWEQTFREQSTQTFEDPMPPQNSLSEAIASASVDRGSVAVELLKKLKDISDGGPIPTVVAGDTGVGMTLEDALGIPPNSSKKPDYKGIELKASRTAARNKKGKNRVNLFAQVPDWSISKLKSSAEILDTYGYISNEGMLRLYCTVTSQSPNAQNLILNVDFDSEILREQAHTGGQVLEVVAWKFEKLRSRLLEKHPETFWVKALTKRSSGVEHFHYVEAIHTRSPNTEALPVLIDDGTITFDHTSKRDKGRVTEHGPFFKIWPGDLDSILVTQSAYDLTQ